MKCFVLVLFLVGVQSAVAADSNGVTFSVGAGMGKASIENPDQTKAHYKVLALQGRGQIPLIYSNSFEADLVGAMRYLDLENTANNSYQSEVANLIGPGVGLELRAFKFVLGAEYHIMLARHYAVGSISRDMKYEMPMLNLYGGLNFQFNQLAVSISYSQGSATVPKASSGLTKDSPYTDQIYWLQLTYSTGASFTKFISFLF
jgi:hypothetical protein